MSVGDFHPVANAVGGGVHYFRPVKPERVTVAIFGSGAGGGGGIASSAKAEMLRTAYGMPDGRIGMSIGEHIQKVLGPDHYADEVKLPVDWPFEVPKDMVRGLSMLPEPKPVHTDRAADAWRAERESYRDMIQKLLVRNMHLENELKQAKQRLSFSWEHLPDVATPEPKIKPMPVNALRPRQRHPMPWLKLPD